MLHQLVYHHAEFVAINYRYLLNSYLHQLNATSELLFFMNYF